MSSSAETQICPLCGNGTESGDTVELRLGGANGVNRASKERGDNICVTVGTIVHVSCRKSYTNKNYVASYKRKASSETVTVKRSERLSVGSFNNKTDCFFCGHAVIKDKTNYHYEEFSCVYTSVFVTAIEEHINGRSDEWATDLKGRLEYFTKDLHAADCVYHQTCDSNFRTGRAIPLQHIAASTSNVESSKRRKIGRPVNTWQELAFAKVCSYFEENDDEQVTIKDLVNRMSDMLLNTDIMPYSAVWMKRKLLDHYGDSLVISQADGLIDIVTFREKTDKILRDHFQQMKQSNIEDQKRAIIETAAKFIKTDIKALNQTSKDNYPSTSEIELDAALRYIPSTLHDFLKIIFTGKNTSQKEASIGQAIVQAVRPRAIIAPLQIGLAVQLYHQFRSKFLLNTLYKMGFCSSYSEVLMFEENAAHAVSTNIFESVDQTKSTVLFAADNVDHNLLSLDGKDTFHGMGMIAGITPGIQHASTVRRQKLSEIATSVLKESRLDIYEYRSAKQNLSHVRFKPINLPGASLSSNVDIMWELSCQFESQMPNWSGMMQSLHINNRYPGKSSVLFLPMIDMYPGDKTCIYSTLKFLSKLASEHKFTPVVTFDQPLFWKASEMLNEVPASDSICDITLLLGNFHTFMNLLGAIGTIMESSGLKEVLCSVYGENAVFHMLNGKSVQRAFRGHTLVYKCLNRVIIELLLDADPQLKDSIDDAESLYMQAINTEVNFEELMQSDVLKNVKSIIDSKKQSMAERSHTSKLWLNYMKMIELACALLYADRTGSWELHLTTLAECLPIFSAAGHANYLKSVYLYLQTMTELKDKQPDIYSQFVKGLHVVRRTDKFWAGLSSDLVIEQTLMRSLKCRGGLTRGSGMTEHQRAIWTMSSPVLSEYNYVMQQFTQTTFTTSEQHKEESKARLTRDETDCEKITCVLKQYSPFTEECTLRNIITGVNAGEGVDVHNLFDVGRTTVKQMENQSVFSFSYKRKNKAKTFSSTQNVQVSEDRSINAALLFQRFLVISQSGDLSLKDVIDYELSPYPPALFEDKYILHKSDKYVLLECLRDHVSSKISAVLTDVPKTDTFVIDGGSLLHRLTWNEGETYMSIADKYVSFTYAKYGENTTVVFDGYSGKPTTKDNTHKRRNVKVSNHVDIQNNTKFVGKMKEFLANGRNKQTLINIIASKMEQKGLRVVHASADADTDIVNTALQIAITSTVTIIGEDTDILILLLYHTTSSLNDVYYRSDKNLAQTHVYNIKVIQGFLGRVICNDLLFAHAFSGCDTTSRIFGVGKKSIFNKTVNGEFEFVSTIFCTSGQATQVIEEQGCKAMVAIFKGKDSDTLSSLRYDTLCKKVVSANNFVNPEKLPPTSSATALHSRRTYLQIMEWTGKDQLNPCDWGWKEQDGSLIPQMMDNAPAPDSLLKVVRCNCRSGCATKRCSCKKYGLNCTIACGSCLEQNCDNVLLQHELEDAEIEDIAD